MIFIVIQYHNSHGVLIKIYIPRILYLQHLFTIRTDI